MELSNESNNGPNSKEGPHYPLKSRLNIISEDRTRFKTRFMLLATVVTGMH